MEKVTFVQCGKIECIMKTNCFCFVLMSVLCHNFMVSPLVVFVLQIILNRKFGITCRVMCPWKELKLVLPVYVFETALSLAVPNAPCMLKGYKWLLVQTCGFVNRLYYNGRVGKYWNVQMWKLPSHGTERAKKWSSAKKKINFSSGGFLY